MKRPQGKPRAGVAVVVVFAVLTGCTGDDGGGVAVAPVQRATVTEVVEAPATVEARATSTLTAPTEGTLADVLVRDGERVAAGTLIARISSPATEARLRQARTALAEAESAAPGAPPFVDIGGPQSAADVAAGRSFATARRAAERVADPRQRAAALTAIGTAERQYALAAAQARAAVDAINTGIGNLSVALGSLTAAQRTQAQVAVDAAERAVDALDVRAPIAGTVQLGGPAGGADSSADGLGSALDQLPDEVRDQAASALGGTDLGGADSGGRVQVSGPVSVGMPVSTGMPLGTIVDAATLSLVAEVDETDVLLVRRGVPATVELDAVPGATYSGTVQAVGLSPTSSSRGGVAYRVRLSLRGGRLADGTAAPRPRPGMSAVADLRVRTARDALAVPAAAILRSGGRDAVWLVLGGRARRQQVTVGTEGEDLVQVTDGLQDGALVVVRGADTVSEGQDLPAARR